MTVSAQNSYIAYTGNGSTTAYAWPYKVYASSDIKVYTVVIATGVETLQTAGGSGTYDYSISVASNNDSATVTLSNNLPSTHKIYITRIQALSQELDVIEGDAFPAASFEQQLDKLTLQVQQQQEQLERTPKYRQSTGLRSTGTIFPSAAANSDNAGKMILYNSDGTALETSTFSLSGVTATEAELNILDGCTLTTAELNQFDGFTIADEDNMASNSATKLATQQSIKAYVDAVILTEDTLAEMNDVNITSAADGAMLLYDTGTSKWIDNVMSGDATMADTGAVTIANNAVETAMINADAVTNAKIADDSIDSEHYVDGSIDTAHIADSQITNAKMADNAIDTAEIAASAVETAKINDAAVTTAKITDGNVTTAKIAADAVTGAKIADDAINSEHYTDGSIDTAHIADSQVTTAKIAADAITAAKIADAAVSEEHLDPTVISGLTDATIASADHIMFFDATDSALKKVDASELGVGGGSLTSLAGDSSPQLGGTLDVNGNLIDMNGLADGLVLDADGDTTISSPTDDQIDIEIAGADDFTFTANTFTALSGSDINIASGATITNNGTATGFGTPLRPNAKPLIINGGMEVAQRGTSFTGQTGSAYTLDRIYMRLNDAGTYTITQDSDVPEGYGFSKSMKIDCTTANDSLEAADFIFVNMRFEKKDMRIFNKGTSSAKKITCAAWVKSPKTGTHVVGLYDAHNTRYCMQTYTISSANTWTKAIVTFPADTAGNEFDIDSTHGMNLQFWFAAGSNYTSGSAATAWESYTQANQAVGQVDCSDSTSNNILITGMQMEVGEFDSTTIPSFQHEMYDDTLLRCHRYFVIGDNTANGLNPTAEAASATTVQPTPQLRRTMRVSPTLTANPVGFIALIGGSGTTTTLVFSNMGQNGFRYGLNHDASISTQQNVAMAGLGADFDAEL